jgi:thioredoxin reductase (NADPH)
VALQNFLQRSNVSEAKRELLDVLIIGAGPAGLSIAIEAKRAGLSYVILEKGAVANSILRYPTEMKFFSTPPLLEIGQVPFITPSEHPSRIEGLTYYREVADHFDLNISLSDEVTDLKQELGDFVVTSSSGTHRASNVVIATGYFDNPAMLNIPGETLPHVSHYYTEGHAYYRREVVIIGSQNSAAEAALDLLRHKANVTMVMRRSELGESVKYWIKPNLVNRIKDGAINAYFESQVLEIETGRVRIQNAKGESKWLACDELFALTGYHPNVAMLERFGVRVQAGSLIPEHNPDTFETNIPSLFIGGSVACGCETGTIFIENGRLHAYTIIGVIKRRLSDKKKTRVVE